MVDRARPRMADVNLMMSKNEAIKIIFQLKSILRASCEVRVLIPFAGCSVIMRVSI